MATDETNRSYKMQVVFEALFSLNLAYAAVSIAYEFGLGLLIMPFSGLEVWINRTLQIRQTDYIRGYITVSLPSILGGILIWLVLRLMARRQSIRSLFQSAGGILVFLVPPVFWIIVYSRTGWPFGWPYRGAPFEIAAALLFAIFFLYGFHSVQLWGGVALLHFIYWLLMGRTTFEIAGYAGPAGPMLGLFAAVAWGVYLNRLKGPERAAPNRISRRRPLPS